MVNFQYCSSIAGNDDTFQQVLNNIPLRTFITDNEKGSLKAGCKMPTFAAYKNEYYLRK